MKPFEERRHVGEMLRMARTTKGWTIPQLAKRAGIGVATIDRIEHAIEDHDVRFENVLAMIEAMGLRIELSNVGHFTRRSPKRGQKDAESHSGA